MSHKIIPIEEAPKRRYKKGSIYDDVIDDFIEKDISLARIEMTKASNGLMLLGTYLSGQLRKRIKERELTNVTAKTINKEAYLEKL